MIHRKFLLLLALLGVSTSVSAQNQMVLVSESHCSETLHVSEVLFLVMTNPGTLHSMTRDGSCSKNTAPISGIGGQTESSMESHFGIEGTHHHGVQLMFRTRF